MVLLSSACGVLPEGLGGGGDGAATDAAVLPLGCLDGVCQAAIRSFDFSTAATDDSAAAATAGVRGFNLDGLVTDEGDDGGCGIADSVSPTGEPGIDNQLGTVLGNLGPVVDIVGGLVQDSINEGGVLYVVEIHDYTGPGDRTARGRLLDVDSTPLVGNDGVLLRGQTLMLDPEPVMGELAFTVDADGVFETAEPFAMRLPFEILDANEVLDIQHARLRFRLDDDGTLQDGLIGGGLVLQGIFDIIANYAVGDEIREVVPPLLNLLADLGSEADPCSQLSIALGWEAVPVFAVAATGP